MMTNSLCATVLALLAAAPAWTAAQEPRTADTQAARQAAEVWLQQLDAGRYAETWRDAATMFKTAVPQPTWEQAVKSTREPLGSVQTRAETSAKTTTSLPGVPDGQYVLLTYSTRFQHKQRATETVATVLQPDGAWKVAGYFVN